MSAPFTALFVYLRTTPLLGLAATLVAWQGAVVVSRRLPRFPLFNPMPLAILALVVVLLITGTPYSVYFQGGQYVQFLLGPATVALAVPMHANLHHIRRTAYAIIPAIVAGSAAAAASHGDCQGIRRSEGGRALARAEAGHQPIAMGIAEQVGGQPALAAVFVLLTGLAAVLMSGPLMRLVRVRDWRANGLADGTAGHGLATAHLLTINETGGALAGLAIGINGVVTAVLVPLLARLL